MLMLEPANLLVLDEPTNDLDLQTLGILEECLEDFPGAVLLVSHDRAFMNAVCDRNLAFPELVSYADMNQWEKARRESLSYDRATAKASTKGDLVAPKEDAPAKKRKLTFKEQRELDTMEATILEKETRLGELHAESCGDECMRNPKRLAECMQKIADLQAEVDAHYARWSELEAVTKS
jgi:ATP-binding cassette subfamily F protein uup